VALDPSDLHDFLDTATKPLNAMDETELCPGAAALDRINAALR
jgi:2-oxoglutarate ferredoxin oxidoreductase subunit beta